jgi:hypothetical protein
MMRVVALLAAALILVAVSSPYWSLREVTAQVTFKERLPGYYLVFAEGETFVNRDSAAFLKFNSSDIYGRIPDNSTCEFLVTGFRIPIMSRYRNILEADCERNTE